MGRFIEGADRRQAPLLAALGFEGVISEETSRPSCILGFITTSALTARAR